MDTDCDHTWKKSGLWDGKTPGGKRTGGILYKCIKCGDTANTMWDIKQKGGSFDSNSDVHEKPLKQ